MYVNFCSACVFWQCICILTGERFRWIIDVTIGYADGSPMSFSDLIFGTNSCKSVCFHNRFEAYNIWYSLELNAIELIYIIDY